MLSNPALADVPAVKNGRLLGLTPTDVSSGTGGLSGLQKMAAWLHPDLVQ